MGSTSDIIDTFPDFQSFWNKYRRSDLDELLEGYEVIKHIQKSYELERISLFSLAEMREKVKMVLIEFSDG